MSNSLHWVLKKPDYLPGQIITAGLQSIMTSGKDFTHRVTDEKTSTEMLYQYDIYLGKINVF